MTSNKLLYSIYSVKAFQRMLGRSLAFYMKVLSRTCSFEVIGEEYHLDATQRDSQILHLFWHEQQMTFMAYALKYMNVPELVMLVEGGDRGVILSQTVASVGADAAVPVQIGSGSFSGGRNLLALIKKIKSGRNGVLTPDGPDGPAFEMKRGAMLIAKKTGSIILPCGSWIERGFKLDRWDEYLVPYPFTKVTMAFGEPFFYDESLGEEEIHQKVTRRLNEIRETARQERE